MNTIFSDIRSALGSIEYYILVEGRYRLLSKFSKQSGITETKRTTPLIVSLTTFPARFDTVFLCIESLLQQSLRPDYLILWVAENDGQVPTTLIRLQDRGLHIKRCKDLRSYKKIIPTLKEYPRSVIVTADDDIFYPKHWLRELYEAYLKEPQFIHCHRAHLVTRNSNGLPAPYRAWNYGALGFAGPSKLLFPTGAGGVLYPISLHTTPAGLDSGPGRRA